ncbi:MAG: hypothetical protein JSU00_12375 [Acidobacteria bacterium]|nr:hypothetical protein [Acidobacteriota bacterium]
MRYALVLLLAAPAAFALGPDFCANCHEIRPQVELWRKSTHRSVTCTTCHEYNLMRNVQRTTAHLRDRVPEQPKLGTEQALAMVEKCRSCHQQQYDDWKAGPHSATYARLFTNQAHNTKRKLMDDCLRCHGMHFDGGINDLVTPINTQGPWKIAKAGMADRPTMPCLTCHTVHRAGEPVHKPEQRSGLAQSKVRPSLGMFDRRSRMNIAAAMLPIPAVFDGQRPVKMSPDERQGLCYQCHAALAQGNIASGDDRTPVGVHEGLSCFACHQGHQQNTRASCGTCHPRLSNCGIDVEKMDTTFKDAKSRHNVHTVKCLDCHPSGVPRRPARSIQ